MPTQESIADENYRKAKRKAVKLCLGAAEVVDDSYLSDIKPHGTLSTRFMLTRTYRYLPPT